MKLLVIAVAILLEASAVSDSEFFEKVTEELIQVSQKCAEESKATFEDVAEIIAHKFPPSTHEAKCSLACAYKHYKMMTSSGTFDKSAVIEFFEPVQKMHEEMHSKILKVIDACENSEQVADHCETASIMATCVENESKKIGLNRDDFILAINKP